MNDSVRSLHTMRSDGSLNRRHILECCRMLRANLGQYVAVTEAAAPTRQSRFELSRPDAFVSKQARDRGQQLPESELERKLWNRWKRCTSQREEFLPGHCSSIQCYQFPLKKVRKDTGWGKIDLLGVSPSLLPVVIELKAKAAKDPLHQVILEGVAYAIAVRKAWRASKGLRQEWAACLDVPLLSIPVDLPTIKVICLAPPEYWVRAFSPTRVQGQIPMAARDELQGLISDLLPHGFELLLAEIRSEAAAQVIRIPSGTGVSP